MAQSRLRNKEMGVKQRFICKKGRKFAQNLLTIYGRGFFRRRKNGVVRLGFRPRLTGVHATTPPGYRAIPAFFKWCARGAFGAKVKGRNMPKNRVRKKVFLRKEQVKKIFDGCAWKPRPDLRAKRDLALGSVGQAEIFENEKGEIFIFEPGMFSGALHKNEASFLAQCELIAKNRGKVPPNE